jgi:hypothetical protein
MAMPMNRRQFIATTSASAAALAMASSGCVTSLNRPRRGGEARKTRSSLDREQIVAASPGLQGDFKALLVWMKAAGWTALLKRIAGVDLDPANPDLEAAIMADLKVKRIDGFADFGGERAIHPGDPAMSLIYHALASPYVRLTEAGQEVDVESRYPTLKQLDTLENYIYARARLSPGDLHRNVVLAVFAYEYRPSINVPHQYHADLVFSRTGIARVGTEEAVYSQPNRSHLNYPRDPKARGAAVTPARYGLFLAECVKARHLTRRTREFSDWNRSFLLPVRKISASDYYVASHRIDFMESHRNEKLGRLTMQVPLPDHPGFDTNKSPFLRQSASSTWPGSETPDPSLDRKMVRIRPEGASALLSAHPGELVREAWYEGKRLRFSVPPKKPMILDDLSNRRYTTLKLLADTRDARREALDFAWSDVLPGLPGWGRTGLRSPRNGPVFVNIRYCVNERGDVSHIDRETTDFEGVIERGGYGAAMFEDGLCDGCIDARINPREPAELDPVTADIARQLVALPILPAFSIVAAPDLMPYVAPNDFVKHDKFFLEGGPNVASGGRLRANPHIVRPGTGGAAFPAAPRNDIESAVADTITAVVSAHANTAFPNAKVARDWRQTNTLPDNASNVFAPGWELTFSRDRGAPAAYVATFGLGSPFPEDMKLCAAANGMWPGSSPDAARTFYGDLKPVFSRRWNRKPPTAVPLTDVELGLHRYSPAVVDHEMEPRAGWDGEYGPFLEVVPDTGAAQVEFEINYADLMESDYVAHALHGHLDLSILRDLSTSELIDRMGALRRALKIVPRGSRQPRYSRLWVVSAERVQDWTRGASGHGLPRAPFGGDLRWATEARPGINGRGMLYVLAEPKGKGEQAPRASGRRRIACRAVYLCQATRDQAAWVRLDPLNGKPPVRAWRSG